MTMANNKFWECPKCSCSIAFELNYDESKYVSLCPFCENELEVEREEFERDNEDYIEIYFKADF